MGLPGPCLSPSWLPDQLLLRFQFNGTCCHSLPLSGPGSSLLPSHPLITSMLHTGFPGLTLLSDKLPPTSPPVPSLVYQVPMKPSHQHVPLPSAGGSPCTLQFLPNALPFPEESTVLSCSLKTPGKPWLYSCSAQHAPPTQSLGISLPQLQEASLYSIERKPRLREALHLCQALSYSTGPT